MFATMCKFQTVTDPASFVKPFEINILHSVGRSFATRPWVQKLQKTMTKARRAKLSSEGVVIKHLREDGSTSVSQSEFAFCVAGIVCYFWLEKCCWKQQFLRQGGPKLKSTQIYPEKFARKLHKWHRAFKAGYPKHNAIMQHEKIGFHALLKVRKAFLLRASLKMAVKKSAAMKKLKALVHTATPFSSATPHLNVRIFLGPCRPPRSSFSEQMSKTWGCF